MTETLKFAPAIASQSFEARNYNVLTQMIDCSKPEHRGAMVIVILGEFETDDSREGTVDVYRQSGTGNGLTITNMGKPLDEAQRAQIEAWRVDPSQHWRFALILDHKQDIKR